MAYVTGGMGTLPREPSELDRLTTALRRLASADSFTAGLGDAAAELSARIQFARDTLGGGPQLDPVLGAVVREVLAEQAAADQIVNR